jgi:hypothetical protein
LARDGDAAGGSAGGPLSLGEPRSASRDHRDRFAQAPTQYAPQYGGYCAWAVSRGYTADIDPEAWRIVEGRLYLNYSKRVQRRWEQEMSGNIAKGNANWPGVLSK